MIRRMSILAALACVALAAHAAVAHPGGHGPSKIQPSKQPAPVLETLLKSELARVADTEVIVSRVTLPPSASLPKHWHPGEEFAHLLAGSVILWREGEGESTHRAGETIKIPLKQVHSARTAEEGATILVFRVHEKGKPERVLAD